MKTYAGGALKLVRTFRLPAVFCALTLLLCALLSHPFAETGIADDGLYIRIAQRLAAMGHIVYNGNTTPMLGWQLCLGAALIKLFGFSFTTVRMSTLLVATVTAGLLQRTLARAGLSEGNATVCTLAVAASPLYLQLSVSYMTDIFGLFAMVLCLYGCLRALQAATDGAVAGWIWFAVAANAIFGTARQIAWLGLLVMVPSTLYLLSRRDMAEQRRRVLWAGAMANVAGGLFLLGCMAWFLRQPYNVHESVIPKSFPVAHIAGQMAQLLLEGPFLLLPLFALGLAEVRKSPPRVIGALLLGYFVVGAHPFHPHPLFALEPSLGDWVTAFGFFSSINNGAAPVYLGTGLRVALTVLSIGGLIGWVACLIRNRRGRGTTGGQGVEAAAGLEGSATRNAPAGPEGMVSREQLNVLLGPFTAVYLLLLIPRASTRMMDRYLLPLLVVAALWMGRYYQERIGARIPLAAWVLTALMAVYSSTTTYNGFSLYRAIVSLGEEVRAAGVPDTAVDHGWAYNFDVELRHSKYINEAAMALPAHAYRPAPQPPAGQCHAYFYDYTPHVHPLYGFSFEPDVCAGPAPFAPVQFSRWPYSTPGTLYVVRYAPAAKLPAGMP
ncbi:MAG: ArnT family glycosyltransferase [Acidobacteriaceae bacterium]